jgi:hypothetical protein
MAEMPMRPTSDDRAKVLDLLWTPAGRPLPHHPLVDESYHHDHDEELRMYWWDASPNALAGCFRPRRGDLPYWVETGSLVREYLILQAGPAYTETLRHGFVAWLQRSPAERSVYENSDDMARAGLVDTYLNAVR